MSGDIILAAYPEKIKEPRRTSGKVFLQLLVQGKIAEFNKMRERVLNLPGTNLEKAELKGAKLERADLSRANPLRSEPRRSKPRGSEP